MRISHLGKILGQQDLSPDDLDLEPISEEPNTPPQDVMPDGKFWSDLGTRLWRTQRQLERTLKTEPSESVDRISRRFQEIIEILQDYDIEIYDYAGEKYDPGLNLRVLQYEPQEGISEEIIIETVKPSIRVKKVLFPGEIIVATPIIRSETADG